ncbi:MAG: hypothetical protein JNM84_08080 [Planctomycetes bacterium]|nr:hypothetical protein [Planctomycetota bacterium]
MLENGDQLSAILYVNRVGVFEGGNIIDIGALAPATSSIRLPVSFHRSIQDPILTSADVSPLVLDGSFVRGASDGLSTDYELHARVTITDPAKRGPFKIAATVMSSADEQRHAVEIVGRIEHGIWSARDSSRGIPLGTRCRGRAVPIEVEIGSSGVDDEFLIASVAIERAGPSTYAIGDMPKAGLTLAPQSTLKIPLNIIPTNSGLICGIVELRGRFLLGSNEDKVLRIPFAGIAD